MIPPDARLDPKIVTPLLTVVAIDAIGVGVVLPLLPFYAEHFGATPFTIGALVAAFSLAQFIASPWLGRLSDRFGRKPILIASQFGTLASFLLLAAAPNLTLIFAARILDGLTAGNLSIASAYAVDHSTPRTRKQAVGIVSAAIGIGLMIGPALSAALAHISVTAPILGAAVLSALSIVATLVLLPNSERPAKHGQVPSLQHLATQPLTCAIFALLAAFYCAFAMYISQLALYMNARFLWHGLPLGPREVGIAFTFGGVVNIFVQFFAMRRIGRILTDSQLAIAAPALLGTGFVLLGLAHSLPLLAAALICTSFGAAFTRPTLMAALTLTVSSPSQGAVMGANGSLIAINNILGPLLAGFLIERHWFAGWSWAMAILMLLTLLGTLSLIIRRKWPAD
ncbi:MFS transporter [Kozakia baliensis]|uniref:Uncharacterized protein n=1 Tax=Kozakia baliensis TaxID=153496 RepID=A0A1D8UQU5_9PROT|nr:MFS transporter [Kozakia baliensis]AOX16004.1 hypothetical protein A0U89_01360 [Kozakia baliensis]GBR27198.1 major facilitator transporter [Kozakia baliensis NRIC 0488]GEL64095.1 tetracycline resistance MFS efflux pump [Kozakia baliensis]